MRIGAGQYKGRRVEVPPGIIRPVMDRMRKVLFSVLCHSNSDVRAQGGLGDFGGSGCLSGRSFLDLFSGSGIVALEAASRGARPVRAVERDRGKRRVLLRNLSIAEGSCALSLLPVEAFLERERNSYDIVFVDPPFAYKFKENLLQRIVNSAVVHGGTLLCVHFPKDEALPSTIAGESRSRSAHAGETCAKKARAESARIGTARVAQGILSKNFGQSLLRLYRVASPVDYTSDSEGMKNSENRANIGGAQNISKTKAGEARE